MEKFVKILKKLFPFTIILILVYFVPPIFILVQQEEEVIERMLTADLMILNPGISFIASMAFGVRNGFHWYFVLLVVILFFLCLLFIYGFSFFGFLLLYTRKLHREADVFQAILLHKQIEALKYHGYVPPCIPELCR